MAGAIDLHHEVLKGLSTSASVADMAVFAWQDDAANNHATHNTIALAVAPPLYRDRGRLYAGDLNLPGLSAPAAEKRPPVCVVCLLPSRHGLVTTCSTCGHGGHFACMADWFSGGEGACPAGCSCTCVDWDAVARERALKIQRASGVSIGIGGGSDGLDGSAREGRKSTGGQNDEADADASWRRRLPAAVLKMREQLLALSAEATQKAGESTVGASEADDGA